MFNLLEPITGHYLQPAISHILRFTAK